MEESEEERTGMRKMQKRQAEEFTALLAQVHGEIKKYMEKGNVPEAQVLLSQCQEGALALGELLEKTEGENFPAISLLEEYCEELYQIYKGLTGESEIEAGKVYQKLQAVLHRIESSIRDDAGISYEVVFLPYKASMWDSMESVWKAADEDPDCNAYVIPIPYYDKNPDGSYGEMHYEAGRYPADVPLLHYEDYDFEKRRPDMIFIHNPYDEYNYVTSVMPFFYSGNLKQFTERLVYIPYFILGEIQADDKKAMEGMDKFCLVQGVINADRVIVQSEDMRRVYIEVLTKKIGEKSRGYWGKKILGLGSPKVDKVLGTRREDLEIPEEWRKVIERPDGSWKQIVFYNTSVSALLNYSEKMLEKMRDVFRVFYENRENIALLWRPHPLIQATITSMRPQLGEKYRQLVGQYREGGWGIYDDSADMDRAAALSDAYYGDPSSVQWLFQKAGKTFILQDVNWKNHVRYAIAAAEAVCCINGEYWYAPYWNNGLYRMNCETCETRREAVFQEKGERGLFAGIVPYGDKLFFIPRMAEAISVYDRQKRKMYQLQFQKNSRTTGAVGSKFRTYIVMGNCLYCIPVNYHALMMIHMDTDEIEQFPVCGRNENKVISTGNGAVIEDDIIFAYKAESCVIRFHHKRKTMDKIFPGNEKRMYSHIFCVEQKLWLIPVHPQDGIRVWDPGRNVLEERIALPKEIVDKPTEQELSQFPKEIADSLRDGESAYFGAGILHGNEIHLLANFLGKNLILSTKEKRCEVWEVQPECFESVMCTWVRNLKMITFVPGEGRLYAVSGISGEWYQYRGSKWEQVEKQSFMVEEGRRMLLLDNGILDWARGKEHKISRIGREIYWKLKKEL